ncbi:hypothetical protein EXS54_01005 [Patescibacteria group bacterium]|nr:hypothetical protein [Patescibacteria group bacterium]
MIAAWAQPLIFNTDTWVETVGPLPQNEAVATAVADDAVTALFQSQDVEGKIKGALPAQAGFLAAPLSSQIKTSANKAARNVIQSEQFSTIWTSANRLAHEQFLKLIKNKPDERLAAARGKAESVTLDLGAIQQQIRSTLGITGEALIDPAAVNNAASTADEVSLNLESKIKDVRRFATVVDRLNKVLPIVAISLFLAALAVSRRRQKTLLVAGVAIVVTSTLLLIALKGIRPEVVNMGSNVTDQSALGAIWDQVTNKLHSASKELMIPGFLVILLALVAGPYESAVRFRESTGLHKLATSQAAKSWQSVRRFIDSGRHWFRGAGIVIVLASLLVVSPLTLAGIVGAVALTVAYLSVVEIIRPTEA